MKIHLLVKTFLLTYLLYIVSSISAQAPTTNLQGVIIDSLTNEPASQIVIHLQGTHVKTTTDEKGFYSLTLPEGTTFPVTLKVYGMGYIAQEVVVKDANSPVQVTLTPKVNDAVIYSASRKQQKVMESPVAIEVLDARTFKNTPAPNYYDALENVKGVQMITSSLTFKVPNTRGFNSPNNFRFMQMVDGVDMQAATLGVPLGSAIGPTELDVQSMEILPGASSALYGMNAINGMANIYTKNPWDYQGLSIYQRFGINHVDGIDRNPSPMSETSIRYAKAINKHFAFKVNGSYMQGTDWLASNTTDQNPQNLSSANPKFPELSGANNPAADLWNRYGDESNNAVSVSAFYQGKDQTFNVRRTGYMEKDVVLPTVRNIKADGMVSYRIKDSLELSYGYRFGLLDGVFQRGNKIQMKDVTVQNHNLQLKGKNFYVRTYMSIENTGNSYNLKPLTDNLDLDHLSNAAWTSVFQTSLQDGLNSGQDLATAMNNARTTADAGRYEPGTAEFDQMKNTIIGINNWDHASNVPGAPSTGGAWLKQRSHIYHIEGQYDFSRFTRKYFDLQAGADYRLYEVIPDGNNFVDFSKPLDQRNTPGGNNVYYSKLGGWAQVSRKFFNDHLKVYASLRYDKNFAFTQGRWNPRVAAVYSVNKSHSIRGSFQNGFRFPALFEAVSYVNNGNVRRVGGLAGVNEGLGYNENSYTLSSINNFTAAVNADVAAGMNRNQAALKNRALLEVSDLGSLRPERINSFEIGYKGRFLNGKLSLDLDFYYNIYDGFLGQVEVAVPVSGQVGTDEAVLDMTTRTNQTRYRVYTNAKNTYYSYGSALGTSYKFYKDFVISANVSNNNIKSYTTTDIFVTGFNTPKWMANASISNRRVYKTFGFNLLWKWQDAFLWQSPLANGTVPAYYVFDAQVSYDIPESKTTIKVGATDFLNKRYIQYAAGPTIGGLYYASVTIDGLFSK